MSPNPIMGQQPVEEARKLIRSGTARELGEQILPDVAVSNIDWLIQDANRCQGTYSWIGHLMTFPSPRSALVRSAVRTSSAFPMTTVVRLARKPLTTRVTMRR
jgi:hypothetical protein